MKTRIDEMYKIRPATMADVPAATQTMNAWAEHLLGVAKYPVDEIAAEWQTPGFDLSTDTRLVLAPNGLVAGYEEVWDQNYPHTRIHCWGRVHPQHTQKGIGAYLLAWAESRARRTIPKAPADARVVLIGSALAHDEASKALYESAGFQVARHFLRMVITLNGKSFAPQWPEGIQVRTLIPGQDERAAVQAMRDSFKDHWGFQEQPFEVEFQRWQHFMENSDLFDPSLWFLAMDGDQVAGISLCNKRSMDDEDMGWVGTLGVRREYRGRGVALALLQHSFDEFTRRGKSRVGLGVDAQSLTGATRLYLKAGMQSDPLRQTIVYEKELRSGRETSTQAI